MLGLMGSVAEFERSIIKERQSEEIARAKTRGIYKGRVKPRRHRSMQPRRLSQLCRQISHLASFGFRPFAR